MEGPPILAELPIVFLTHSDVAMPVFKGLDCVKMPKDPFQYAHCLYQRLRMLDQHHYQTLFIESVPKEPEWKAINDRLQKACELELV